jgi:hypothetical protein
MENFFNYISKPIDPEDVELWFRINNIYPEKMNLFFDFIISLNMLINDTYLGEEDEITKETKITLSDEDMTKHFKWCWDKTIDNFEKENLLFDKEGEHYDYFESFYMEIYYQQKNKKIRESIENFFEELFSSKKPYTKSDLDMILSIYKGLDRTLINKKNLL